MPFKTCGKCSSKNGVRAKKCRECFTPFPTKLKKPSKTSTKPKEKELGTWKEDYNKDKKLKGMPAPAPAQIPTKKLTVSEIRDIVSHEGIDVINGLICPTQIIDKKLARMWEECRIKIQSIIKYIYNKESI